MSVSTFSCFRSGLHPLPRPVALDPLEHTVQSDGGRADRDIVAGGVLHLTEHAGAGVPQLCQETDNRYVMFSCTL